MTKVKSDSYERFLPYADPSNGQYSQRNSPISGVFLLTLIFGHDFQEFIGKVGVMSDEYQFEYWFGYPKLRHPSTADSLA